jgi:hypothetical protein
MTLDEIYAPVKNDLALVENKLAEIARHDIPFSVSYWNTH